MTVTLYERKIRRKVADKLGSVQYVLDGRVAADSNFFAPQDTGDLQGSVLPIVGNGLLEWNTTYARFQYYNGPNKSKDRNPNASMQWFEHAKARNLKEWEAIANAEYNK
jgi:hypothetical protein